MAKKASPVGFEEKSKNSNNRKQSQKKFILLFGIISAVIATLLVFTSLDSLSRREGYAIPVLLICQAILFLLFSVMINRIGSANGRWTAPLFYTFTAGAAAEIVFLIMIGDLIRKSEIILCVLTVGAALLLFRMKDKITQEQEAFIPLVLGIIAAAAGMTELNTAAYSIFSSGFFDNLWIGIALAVLFMFLSLNLTKQAFAPDRKNKVLFISFGTAVPVQAAALIYALLEVNNVPLYIFQVCIFAALAAVTIVFHIQSRKSVTPGRKKKTRK